MNPTTKSARNRKISIKGLAKELKATSTFFSSLDSDYQFYYRGHVRDCVRRDLVPLEVELFHATITQDCHYCGRPPEGRAVPNKVGPAGTPANGIDKIIPALGYVAGNIVPACKDCNQMKSARNPEDFLAHVARVAAFQSAR